MDVCAGLWAVVSGCPFLCIERFGEAEIEGQLGDGLPAKDEVRSNRLSLWKSGYERYDGMIQFCLEHAEVEDYAKYYEQWDQETFCNVALTLIHQADKALMSLLKKMEADFLKEGGVKERMFAARKDQRGF